jgi:hypothetical protein
VRTGWTTCSGSKGVHRPIPGYAAEVKAEWRALIKRLSRCAEYDRQVDWRATASLIAGGGARKRDAARDSEQRRVVPGTTRTTRATLALQDWLEERRAELAERLGQELPRPIFRPEKPGGRQTRDRLDQAGAAGTAFPRKRGLAVGTFT